MLMDEIAIGLRYGKSDAEIWQLPFGEEQFSRSPFVFNAAMEFFFLTLLSPICSLAYINVCWNKKGEPDSIAWSLQRKQCLLFLLTVLRTIENPSHECNEEKKIYVCVQIKTGHDNRSRKNHGIKSVQRQPKWYGQQQAKQQKRNFSWKIA